MEDRLLTVENVAELLNVSPRHVARLSITRYCTGAVRITKDREDLIRLRLKQHDKKHT